MSNRYEGGDQHPQNLYSLNAADYDADNLPSLYEIEQQRRQQHQPQGTTGQKPKQQQPKPQAQLKQHKRQLKQQERRREGQNNKREEPGRLPQRNQQTNTKAPSALSDLFLLIFKILLILILIAIIFTFVFGITQVKDNSMAPAIREGDLVVYYRFQKDYAAQSVIALKVDGETEIRRVIGVSGDEINITDQGLVINSYPQIESNIYTDTLPFVDGITLPVTLADNEVFVLGDNRTEAKDSRLYGAVNKNATLGTVVTVIRRRGF